MAALAIHDYLVVGPEREPVLAVGAFPSLVLGHGAHPARELVLVDQQAARVGLQDRDEGLYGRVGSHTAAHRGSLGLLRRGLAGFCRVAPLNLPLAKFALPFLLVLRICAPQVALTFE